MRVYLPRSYTPMLVGDVLLVTSAAALEPALGALAAAGSLFRFASRHPEASRLEGRGPAYAVPAPGGRWVVRHFRRGGSVARWLGDRYLAVGTPRPVRELLASDAVRRRGIDTPEIAALAVYPAGAFYRADIATVHVPGTLDLARSLFGEEAAPGADRVHACAAAGRLLRALHERGVVHADLNLKNILLDWTMRPPRPYLLDLDRCRVLERVSPRQREAMLGRFRRSTRKWETRVGPPLAAEERGAFEAAYAGIGPQAATTPRTAATAGDGTGAGPHDRALHD